MTTAMMIPQEFFDGLPVPRAVTLDGELLGALDEAPAGPWNARDAQRRHARLASLGSLVLRTRIHASRGRRVARATHRCLAAIMDR